MSHSRRRFLQSAGLAAAPSAQSPAQLNRTSAFAPAARPRRLSDNLYLFEDTCNVFIVRDGDRCVLIDFGSGKILDHLRDLGITKIDWILHTHHHRDQCQGDHKAVERGIPIAVPAHERHLFEDARNFWRNRRVFHLYYVRNDFNTITDNIPVARSLHDYSTFRWQSIDFAIHPTPGHTLGSVTLLATIDGKRTAFTGDLLHSSGKILDLYDTQVNYGGHEGIDFGAYSLSQLRQRKPALLCPSHGDPIPDPDAAMAQTIRALEDYLRFQTGARPSTEYRGYPLSPHVVVHNLAMSTFYAIVSNSGKAMFVDYGSATNQHFNAFERATAVDDRIRFVEHDIAELQRTYGMKSIDVAMPSHTHDDHMNGFPHLMRHYGTKIWCYENMQDIFENPRGKNLGCILAERIKVSRTFRHGEKFRWEEFEFEVVHSPGHTEYQMAMFTTIDGNRLAFTGDAFFHNDQDGPVMRHNIIYRNHVETDSHVKSIRQLLEHEPTMVCPGHGKPFAVTHDMMIATEQRLRRQQQWFQELLPGEPNFGLDPSWVSIYPYQMLLPKGRPAPAEIRVRNYNPTAMRMEIALIAPREWRIEPDVLRFEAAPGAITRQRFQITIPKTWAPPSPRFAIAADVIAGGKYLGQITEAVVELAV